MAQSRLRRTSVLLSALLVVSAVSGCAASTPPAETGARPPVEPAVADLSTPESAVDSYLAWVSFAYRVADSDVASNTMSPEEGVRVDSYIQLNKEQGRVIEQRVVTFRPGPISVEGTRALLPARERWEYRYLYAGDRGAEPVQTAGYDTTYTVVEIRPGTWVVDSVDARALTQVE